MDFKIEVHKFAFAMATALALLIFVANNRQKYEKRQITR